MSKCPICTRGHLVSSTCTQQFDVSGVKFGVQVSCERCLTCDETLVSHHELQRAYLEMSAELTRRCCFSEESLRFIRKTLT